MKKAFKAIAYIFFIYILITVVISLFAIEENLEVVRPICYDSVRLLSNKNDKWHQRQWNFIDYSSSFCTTYESRDSVSKIAETKREKLSSNKYGYEDYWGEIYHELVLNSKSTILFMADSLEGVSNQNGFSKTQLAELVVSFVQDIPYSYVLKKDCSSRDTKGKPCVGGVEFGILSPYEFLHTLFGDCDTRSVLIYSLLEELGFDPMITISDEYGHAMIALNIPATGDHLSFKGKKYYFWETTGKGWALGMLPPNSNNVNYWKIALVNDF